MASLITDIMEILGESATTCKVTIPNAESMMNRQVHCVTAEMSLAAFVQVFRKQDVSCTPVVDKWHGFRHRMFQFAKNIE